MGDNRGAGAGADDADDGRSDPPLILDVRVDEVGRVLGRKGETVKVFERDSSTKIEVDKATGRIEIFGRQEQKDRALEMILAEVNFIKDAEGKVLKDTPRPEKEN